METQENENLCYWTFIEKYYPRYHNQSDVLLSDILAKKIEDEGTNIEDDDT